MRPNKINKRVRAISYMLLIIYDNQTKKASKSYQVILDRLPKVAQLMKDTLPDYTEKEKNQIKRIVRDFANSNFGTESYDSVMFSSFLMAITEKEQNRLDGEHRDTLYDLIEKAYRVAKRMNDYYDRDLNHFKHYYATEKWISKWDYV